MDDFPLTEGQVLAKFEGDVGLVDSWKKMGNLGADDALRKNPGALDALAKKDAGEVVPDPSTYLDADYIANHLAKFDDGASVLTFKSVPGDFGQVGRNDGLFVLSKSEMDDLIQKTGGDISKIETELGIPSGNWSSRVNDPLNPDQLIRLDVDAPSNVRMSTGNELGADPDKWIPGGKTADGGYSEAVIDPIPASDINLDAAQVIGG